MASFKQKEITSALTSFYQKPVAMVSMELLLSLGLVIFLAIFAIQPTLLTMSDLIQERKEKIDLLAKLESKVLALRGAQDLYAQAQTKLSDLNEAIPPQPQLIRSLKIIEKLASENNVIIKSLSVSKIPEEKAITDTTVKLSKVDLTASMSISGDFLNIRAFVQALQNSKRSFVVENVTFNLEESRGEKKLNAMVTLSQPYMGKPE